MKVYGKYSKVDTHMIKDVDDLVPDKRKQNQGRPIKI